MLRRAYFSQNFFPRAGSLAVLLSICSHLSGQTEGNPPPPPAKPTTPAGIFSKQKPASELISKQEPPKITPRVLEQTTPETSSILVSLSKQRAYLMSNGEIAVDTPISSGKKSRMTPKGTFKVMQKDKNHRSSVYGSFVDRRGRTVRSGVSTRIDSAPSGTHYVGAPMLYFLRLTDNGVGMHIGILPGYPASHGCIRLPENIAPIFYEKSKLGTVAEIVD